MDYTQIVNTLLGLAGLGALISILVNVLKVIGIVKDGYSELWYKGLNLLAFVGVAVVYLLEVEVDWSQVDEWLKMLAGLLGLVVQIFGGKITYNTIKGTPFIGFSYTDK